MRKRVIILAALLVLPLCVVLSVVAQQSLTQGQVPKHSAPSASATLPPAGAAPSVPAGSTSTAPLASSTTLPEPAAGTNAIITLENSPVTAPSGLFMQSDGTLIISDPFQHALWKQEKTGHLIKLAGQPAQGYLDGAIQKAAFESPWAVVPYLGGYAVTDMGNNAVRYIGAKEVSTIAGSTVAGFADGLGIKASFDAPTGLATDTKGCLYLSDTGNHAIRHIDTKGIVTTLAGGTAGCAVGTLQQARFREPTGLCCVGNVLYVADSGNNRICKIENNMVTAIAGDPTKGGGFQDGTGAMALFAHPQGLASDGTTVYVSDTGNGAIRVIREGVVSTLLHYGCGVGGLYPVSPRGIILHEGSLYIGDTFARVVFTVKL
ncbi:MAG: hypothetical protein RR022_03345 [Angelakisella sp.]